MQNTINYYEQNEKLFIEGTLNFDFTEILDAFLWDFRTKYETCLEVSKKTGV